MALALEAEQQYCQLFSNGLYCNQKRSCPFIHKWSLFNAARREKANLAKLNGNNTDTKIGRAVQDQGMTEAKVPSANDKRRQSPHKDTAFYKFTQGPCGNNWAKKPTCAQAVNPRYNVPNKAMIAPRSSIVPSNVSSRNGLNGFVIESKVLDSHLLHQKPEECIPSNMATLSLCDRQGRTKWAKVRGHRRNPGAWNNWPEQMEAEFKTEKISKNVPVKTKVSRNFPRFGDLPSEIRDMIWKYAAQIASNNPRVRLEPKFDHKGQITRYDVTCRSLTPALMRTCHDSRAEIIKQYSKVFGGSTYFNMSTGTVFIDSYRNGEFKDFTESITKQELQGIQNLAIKLDEWSISSWALRDTLKKFTSLKRLVFMLKELDDPFYSDEGALKMITKDLRLTKGMAGGPNCPMITLVPSTKVELFLSRGKN